MKTNKGLGWGMLGWLLLLLAGAGMAQAQAPVQTRAWLDRDSISQGETVTLNIETDQSGSPDYTPLQADFVLSGQSSSRQLQLGGGGARNSAVFGVVLSPRRSGTLVVPANSSASVTSRTASSGAA